MKKIYNIIFSSKFYLGILVLLLGTGCSDYLDQEPKSDYLSSNFYNNEGAIKQGASGCYQCLWLDHSNTSMIPYSILWDMYTPYGIERADNSSIGVGNLELRTHWANEKMWSILYTSIARCNAVLSGAEPYYNSLNDAAKVYLAEIKVLRAHFYIYLVSLYGDIPYFAKPVTDEELKSCTRTPWQTVVDNIISDLNDAATILPWSASEWGRVDKSVALGLKARIALYAGSWCKFGYGRDGVKDEAKSTTYFTEAAEAAKKVMDESGRDLAPNFADLFTKTGQMKSDTKKETMFFMVFSDQGDGVSHYLTWGEGSRMFAQSGRFPTQQLVDTYEMSNGKRIDEAGSGYDPKKPFESRDPRLKETVYVHHDIIIGNTGSKFKFQMELFKPTTKSWSEDGTETTVTNKDYTGSVAQYGYVQSGVGFLWKKYDHFDDEYAYHPTYNINILRYAEVLLTYAEAKIELNQLDATVVNAIDKVRLRASVKQPGILSVDPTREGNQAKMRQIVRRERRVELAREMGMLFDMRRWRTGAIQNAEPTYGFLQPSGVVPATNTYPDGYDQAPADLIPSYGEPGSDRDMNDIASYKALVDKGYNLRSRDKDRSWDDKFYLWPIPQTERNKCPWLEQNPGYGE
jgi:hypothetical protein